MLAWNLHDAKSSPHIATGLRLKSGIAQAKCPAIFGKTCLNGWVGSETSQQCATRLLSCAGLCVVLRSSKSSYAFAARRSALDLKLSKYLKFSFHVRFAKGQNCQNNGPKVVTTALPAKCNRTCFSLRFASAGLILSNMTMWFPLATVHRCLVVELTLKICPMWRFLRIVRRSSEISMCMKSANVIPACWGAICCQTLRAICRTQSAIAWTRITHRVQPANSPPNVADTYKLGPLHFSVSFLYARGDLDYFL